MLLWGMALVVSWGAALDIREAFGARRVSEEADMLESAYEKLEQLNNTLRAQRHDFMNHLQVVSSLLELNEDAAAQDYLERVYGDIQKVGRTLKTAHPAINALLAAKMADCEAKGIAVNLMIESAWDKLTMPDWEMCRVLGNIIDNAMDALKGVAGATLTIRMGEDLRAFSFAISNNGPMIPEALRERIFQTGFSTKHADRGMGLAIVRELMADFDGEVCVESDERQTSFVGALKKPVEPPALPAKE
jgi:sensor histidine kinase regulating citrate/malate metabolism